MDYFAIVSLGSFPTPGITVVQRAALFASYGFLDTLGVETFTEIGRGLYKMGMSMTMN